MTDNKLYRMSEASYRELPAANYSTLKHGRESALAMKAAIDGLMQPESKSVNVGSIVDAMVAGDSHVRFAIAPDVDRRTRDGKAAWASFIEMNGHLQIITQDEADLATRITQSINANPDAKRLLSSQHRQVSALWTDPTHGVQCKARIDAFTGGVCLTDLKTTRSSLSDRAFAGEIVRYGYHIQAAFYTDGFAACTSIDTPYTIVAAQNREPFDVAVFRLDDATIEAGRKWYKHLLGIWKHGRDTGEWPGTSAGIQTIAVPKWELDAADRASWLPTAAETDDTPF